MVRGSTTYNFNLAPSECGLLPQQQLDFRFKTDFLPFSDLSLDWLLISFLAFWAFSALVAYSRVADLKKECRSFRSGLIRVKPVKMKYKQL